MNGQYLQILNDCTIEIQSIEGWISDHPFDSNVRFLTAYAVIRTCGTIEFVLKQMLFDHLTNGANEEANSYLSKSIIDSSFNPSPGQIYRILENIKSDWKIELENAIKGSNEKGQLTSLVDLRNSFSHGATITVSINDVKNYYNSGIWILQKLHEIIYG